MLRRAVLLLLFGLPGLGCRAVAADASPRDPDGSTDGGTMREHAAVVVHTRTLAAGPHALAPSVASSAPTPAAELAPVDEDTGCAATVAELRDVDPGDRRLQRRGLLVADKAARRLMLFDRGTLEACWRVGLGFAPKGHKQVEGDGKTPVGWYPVSDKPWSVFDDAIAIHYPSADDADAALRAGRISRRTHDAIESAASDRKVPPQSTAMGGAVLIHGGGSNSDWTLGCIALDDADLDDLRGRLPRGMRTDLLILE